MNFSSLVTRSLQDNNLQYLEELPVELLGTNEKQLVEYILNYATVWGDGITLPSIGQVRKNVESAKYLLTDFPSEETIDKIYTETKRKLVERSINSLIIDAKAKHDDGDLNIEEFTKTLNHYWSLTNKNNVKSVDEADIYIVPSNKVAFKYKSLNDASGGMLGGELGLFVARPKVGKTLVMLDNAIDSTRIGHKVYFASMEMNFMQIAHRVHAMIGGFNPKSFRESSSEQLQAFKEMFEYKKGKWFENGGKFLVPENSKLTIDNVKSDIEKHLPDVIYLDSVYGFIGKNGKPIGDDWGAVMSMVAQLKAIAMEYNIPILCSTQLKRGSGGVDTDLDDISFSDSFGMYADLVVNLYRHSVEGKQVIGLNFLAARHVDPTLHFFLKVDYENMVVNEHVSALFKKYVGGDEDDS